MTEVKDYGEHTVSELVAMINSEHEAIVEADRTNLQRAIGVGEKLNNLKPRVAEHGEWQLWLKNNCPKISIETANLYMRLGRPDNQAKLETAAAAKSVRVTDLTITQARGLLAKPKSDSKKKHTKQPEGGVEPADEPDTGSEEKVGKEWLKVLAADELVSILKEFRDDEYLQELSAALAKVLPKVDPLAIPPILQRTPAAAAATISERRI